MKSLREVGDQLELALARDLERSVRDLDVREALLVEPAPELVELAARVDDLEERAAADDRRLERPVEGDLLLEVVRDVRGTPAELDDVDVLAGGVEEALDLAQVETLVDDVGQALAARLARARGQVEESVKAWHRAPPASSALRPLHVVVEGVAVRVDAHRERAEVLDAELPEALGHELLPGDLLDLLDLRRLERGRAADDREVDHPEPLHRLDRLVREAALAADRAHAVLLAERLGEAHHPRARRGADADGLVLVADLAHARSGVEQEGAAQVHRRLDPLVEDPDLRAVADPDDVALDDDLVARRAA